MRRIRSRSSRRVATSIVVGLVACALSVPHSALASPATVDNVISAIGRAVESGQWTQASKNIEDLSRTIRNEVTVNRSAVVIQSNPVRTALDATEQRLKMLQAEYAIFSAQYEQYRKAAKAGREQARTDIVGDMVTKLTKILGGALAPLEFGKTRNASIIAAELSQLKSLADLGKYITQRQASLRPAIREAQTTRTKLAALNSQWNVVMKTFAGKVTVQTPNGSIATVGPTTIAATAPTKAPSSGRYRNSFVFRIPESRRDYVGAFQADKNPVYWTGNMLINGSVVASYDISSAGEATMVRTFDFDFAPGTKVDVSIVNPKLNYGPMTLSVTTLSEAHTWDVWWFIDSIDVQMAK